MKLAIVLFALLLQSQISSGDIKGIVMDSTGGAVADAAVTVTKVDTAVERTTVTDPAGSFRFFLLQPGDYEIRVEAVGFSSYTRRLIAVAVGETVSVSAVLHPAAVRQELFVEEELPAIEVEKTQQSQ